MRALALLASLAATLCAASPESDRARELINAGDADAARAHIERALDDGSTSNQLLYELARLEAIDGNAARAGATLVAAAAAGFTDFFALSREPRLAQTSEGRTILEHRAKLLEDRAAADFDAVKRAFPKRHLFVRDEALRLQFVSAFDQEVTDEILAELGIDAMRAEELKSSGAVA